MLSKAKYCWVNMLLQHKVLMCDCIPEFGPTCQKRAISLACMHIILHYWWLIVWQWIITKMDWWCTDDSNLRCMSHSWISHLHIVVSIISANHACMHACEGVHVNRRHSVLITASSIRHAGIIITHLYDITIYMARECLVHWARIEETRDNTEHKF